MRPDGDCRHDHGADDDGQVPPHSGRRAGSGGRDDRDRRRRQAPPARNGARVRGIARLYPNSVKDDRGASYQRTSASLHRVRGRLVAERTALINQLRALMLERGITVPQGRRKLERYLPEILADERNGLGPPLRRLIEDARSGEASTSGSKGITMNSPNGYTTRRLPND